MNETNLPVNDPESFLSKIKDTIQGKISAGYSWLDKEEGKIFSRAIASLGSLMAGDPTGILFPFVLETTNLAIRKRFLKHFPDLVSRLEAEKTRINQNFFQSDRGQELFRVTISELIHQLDEEKAEYHKNLLVNSYVQSNADEEKISLYWEILVSLPSTSLRILRVLLNPQEKIKEIFESKKGEDEGDYFSYNLKQDLAKVMNIDPFVFDRTSNELESVGLINSAGTVQGWAAGRYREADYNAYMERVTSDATRLVTEDGKEFFDYVTTKI